MAEHRLRDRRILIAEDEYMLADELRAGLRKEGAILLGPAGTIADTLDLIGSEPEIDGAILDINLRGEMAFPVADLLMARGVPFIFATGYDASVIPSRFEHITRCEKPAAVNGVARAIGRALRG